MNKIRRTLLAFVLVGVGIMAHAPQSVAGTAKVAISMSNFRYCLKLATPVGNVCHPGQFGYARHTAAGGALPGPNNEAGIIDVHPGDRVVWTNVDMVCDFNDGPGPGPSPIDCPGHDVTFEDGSVRSPRLASQRRADVTKPARKPQKFAWLVPAKTRPGKLIRYYCSEFDRSEAHADGGMTGVLRVV